MITRVIVLLSLFTNIFACNIAKDDESPLFNSQNLLSLIEQDSSSKDVEKLTLEAGYSFRDSFYSSSDSHIMHVYIDTANTENLFVVATKNDGGFHIRYLNLFTKARKKYDQLRKQFVSAGFESSGNSNYNETLKKKNSNISITMTTWVSGKEQGSCGIFLKKEAD